ncbi:MULTISPECIES: exopolyphosphatase [Vibrio]|uniref:Exopolyphosphatase n=1 Tax=Vibrio cortegadensis TaxID=1328770 RepID=A0ABV4M2S1_9VIBR|nr:MULTISPECIES: exopolyphosphatase [Vibrio]MDN3697053.1 exopolyphosphatase [Vibrio cortegadensis]RBW64565.1 exopolyphosphatase [Vibrionales bacterium C3R12]TKF21750.1 exopolyphosphatase [Vibrio genomosp. F6]
MSEQKFRLVTRSDFDGLVCAVLLKQQNLIDDIKFVHPKDMQDGKVAITSNDIVTNLPYVKDSHLTFDHHLSETIRNTGEKPNHIIDPDAPSAARVVWDYYGGLETFPADWLEMMEAVDKGDSAQFNRDEVLDSQDWNLLNFLMDARTGLGRFREFRISNYALMMDLIDYCKNHTITEILALPDVQERIDLYREHETMFKEQIQRCATVHQNLVVLDLTNEETIYAGNRFIIYALFPQCNISIHKMWGFQKQNIVFATGKSIFDRASKTNVGELMLKYGGGGHIAAGTCQIDVDKAESVQQELINAITADG